MNAGPTLSRALVPGAAIGSSIGFAAGCQTGSAALTVLTTVVGALGGAASGVQLAWARHNGAGPNCQLLTGHPLLRHNKLDAGKTIEIPLQNGTTSLHYVEFGRRYAGRGTTVLIHGLQSHAYEWASFLQTFAVEDGRVNKHIIVIDLPGFGYSGFLPGHDYHLNASLRLALENFFQQKGLSGVTLVANSLGTAVALTLASRHPELVKELVLFSPLAPIGPEAIIPPPIQIMASMGTTPRAREIPAPFRNLGRLAQLLGRSEIISDWTQQLLFHTMMWQMLYETPENLTPTAVFESARPYLASEVGAERVHEMIEARAGWAAACIDYLRDPAPFDVRHLEQPALLVYGLADRVFNPQSLAAARSLTRQLPHGSLVTVSPDDTQPAGHALPTTNPVVAARIVTDFSEQHPFLRQRGEVCYQKGGYSIRRQPVTFAGKAAT